MRAPVTLCAVCRERLCSHTDAEFAGLAPSNRSSAGPHAGATYAGGAASPRQPLRRLSDHRVIHGAHTSSQVQQDHA